MIVRRLILAAVCTGVLATSAVEAGYWDGNDLHVNCNQEADTVDAGICYGYIVGFADALFDFQQTKVFIERFQSVCLPIERIPPNQLIDVVKKYLTDHPESRHQPGTWIVFEALRQTFPCKNQGTRY